MNIKFPPIDEKYLKKKVKNGFYSNLTEAVRDAVRRMRERDEDKGLKEIRSLLEVGLEQIGRGETVPYTPDFMDKAMKQAVKNSKAGKPVRDEVKPRP